MSNLIAPYLDAPAKLAQSKLTDQLSGLSGDVDLSTLELQVQGKTALQIREAITSASITRTILGASILELTLEDPDYSLLNSGYFGGSNLTLEAAVGSPTKSGITFQQQVDVKLDGLWFRLCALEVSDSQPQITATFQDREVMLLRSYPKSGDPATYKIFNPTMTRAEVMAWLVAQVAEIPGGIRIVCPMLTGNTNAFTAAASPNKVAIQGVDPQKRQIAHMPGLPAWPADITVKGQPANKTQLSNLQAVLDTAVQLQLGQAERFLMTTAIAVITQESTAGNAVGVAGNLFQQTPAFQGLNPGEQISLDPSAQAKAFFGEALTIYQASPSITLGLLASKVQRPQAYLDGSDPNGTAYSQWSAEAQHTVDEYLGGDPSTSSTANAYTSTGAALEGTALFTRGSQFNEAGKTLIVREDNWTCLQRLAREVGWLCYCVEGTVYIEDYPHIFQQPVTLKAKPGDDGVGNIGLNINTGRETAQATVPCRVTRWAAAPGTIVELDNVGPGSGKWIVNTIVRDLFSPNATITLSKPQTTLADAESASPLQGSALLEASGTAPAQTGPGGVEPPLTGFVLYNQADPKWATHAIYSGGNTIGADGCGPTSAAMVIATLKDRRVTPITTGDYMTATGGGDDVVGAKVSGLVDVVEHYGLKAVAIGNDAAAFEQARETLLRGGLVIAGGQGANAPYTAAGHVIVLRAMNGRNFLVANPDTNLANPASGFGVSQLQAETHYIITVTA